MLCALGQLVGGAIQITVVNVNVNDNLCGIYRKAVTFQLSSYTESASFVSGVKLFRTQKAVECHLIKLLTEREPASDSITNSR